jgi:hypothetical protein
MWLNVSGLLVYKRDESLFAQFLFSYSNQS